MRDVRSMGILQRLGLATRMVWRPQTINEIDQWMESAAWGGASASGANVSGETAVNFAAFFSGVMQIAQTVASCKTYIYRERGDRAKEQWRSHPLYPLLLAKPNEHMDAFRWKERMQYHAMVWGNGCSAITRDGAGRPLALHLLNPERVTLRVNDAGAVEYLFRPRTGGEVVYSQAEMFHLPGFGFDGFTGYSLLRLHRDTIGLGLSQQEFSGKFINNGAHMGGVLETTKKLEDDARRRLRESFQSAYASASNAGRWAVLEDGVEAKPLTMPLKDAQFLDSRIFQIQEIARILNISPYKLKDYSHATFSNVEHLGIEYATDTIRPWVERWEAAIDTQLLNMLERQYAFAEFDLDSISRGDIKTQAEADQIARYGGWLNANEIRAKRGRNPIPGRAGEAYWMPENMGDASGPDREEERNEE